MTVPVRACPVCGVGPGAGSHLAGIALNRCSRCGLLFTATPQGHLANYEAEYGAAPHREREERELSAATSNPMQLARIGTYRCFFEVLGPAAGRSLLDVGCGIGRFALAAHAFGWRVMGIDPSATALRVGAPHAPFPLRQETIADHLRANVAYDVVTAFEVVEHLDDPLPFVRDLRSALKPDGSLFVTVPNWDCPAVRSSTVPEHLPPWHVLFFGRRALAALLRAAGLRRVRMGWVFCAAPRRVDPLIRWWANRLLRPARVAPGLWACGVR